MLTPSHAQIALVRGQRVQRIREYDVQRQPILAAAIVQAIAAGYVFDAPMGNKSTGEARVQKYREAHIRSGMTRLEVLTQLVRGRPR